MDPRLKNILRFAPSALKPLHACFPCVSWPAPAKPAKLASTVSSIAFGRSTDGEVTTMVKSQLDKSQHTGHQPQQHRQPMDIDMLEALMVPMQAGCPSNRNHKVLFASQLTTQLPHIVTVTLQL